MEKKHRPLGVTIIAILTIISGILLILGGVSLIAVGALISVNPVDTTATTNSQPIAQFFGVISAAIGSILLAIGIGYIVMFLGLLKGRGWAWTITIILLLIGIAIQIISTATGAVFNASLSNSSNNAANSVISGIIGGIIGIAINGVIVYYLYRPQVKAYFGKV
jgi:predicted lipid-binding transport protein (Tim44 family)